jgi:hypothetical protein
VRAGANERIALCSTGFAVRSRANFADRRKRGCRRARAGQSWVDDDVAFPDEAALLETVECAPLSRWVPWLPSATRCLSGHGAPKADVNFFVECDKPATTLSPAMTYPHVLLNTGTDEHRGRCAVTGRAGWRTWPLGWASRLSRCKKDWEDLRLKARHAAPIAIGGRSSSGRSLMRRREFIAGGVVGSW